MKNSLNIVIVTFIFIVLGCSCPKMADIQKKIDDSSKKPTNSDNVANTATKPAKEDDQKKSSSLTLASYNRVKTGMKLSEVSDILGDEGAEVSSSEVGKAKIITYKWEGEDYSYIICTFNNDKLMLKSQSKLK
jgi:Beta-lactamase inhibitor (BLIP)